MTSYSVYSGNNSHNLPPSGPLPTGNSSFIPAHSNKPGMWAIIEPQQPETTATLHGKWCSEKHFSRSKIWEEGLLSSLSAPHFECFCLSKTRSIIQSKKTKKSSNLACSGSFSSLKWDVNRKFEISACNLNKCAHVCVCMCVFLDFEMKMLLGDHVKTAQQCPFVSAHEKTPPLDIFPCSQINIADQVELVLWWRIRTLQKAQRNLIRGNWTLAFSLKTVHIQLYCLEGYVHPRFINVSSDTALQLWVIPFTLPADVSVRNILGVIIGFVQDRL